MKLINIINTRRFKDSGYFYLNNETDILPNNSYIFHLEDKFKPYNELIILNKSNVNAKVIINLNRELPLPNNTTININFLTEFLEIKNTSNISTINSDLIQVSYRKNSLLNSLKFLKERL